PFILGVWKSGPGFVILFSAVFVHISMSLWVIYQRRSLKMRKWEIVQLVFGLSIPFLVTNHVLATAFTEEIFGTNLQYPHVLANYWIANPESGFIHGVAVLVVWIHGCVGLHYWLKTKEFYPKIQWLMAQAAVVIPTLALAGYISSGYQTLMLASDKMYITGLLHSGKITTESQIWIERTTQNTIIVLIILTITPFMLRFVRFVTQKLEKRPRMSLLDGKSFRILEGASILETMRANDIPIASVCGGRGRCTTCRIRISEGLDLLPAPEATEEKALSQIDAIPSVRLACQLRPKSNLTISPLLPADASAVDGRRPGGLDGMEMNIAVMFVDLRGSTKLGEEKLPYDVLFILNQFFAEMTSSLNATEGHYAQFNGDGLMAIYGLKDGKPEDHAKAAIEGAVEMFKRLDSLNMQLASELKSPLEIGIGVHYGEAIVGAMGPPNNQLIT
ncbi:MAG: adenylate/guanylate cyclase domain-containing protein, partial [Alphaproteobacteria bacterium]|nr:adenylate/guanylate cyclase domain-containing protein [Alphaproteobacteria bacterium]